MKITLIIGLPASGKTTFAEERFPDACLVDDPVSLLDLPKPDTVEHLVISDPSFCVDRTLAFCEKCLVQTYGEVEIERIYFVNDPEQCRKNAQNRRGKMVDSYISYLTEKYNPPRVDQQVWRKNV